MAIRGPAFRAFCLDRRAEIEAIVSTRNTQTNEVGRCAAIVPALELVHRDTAQPLSLLEVGASAGLNLEFDRYASRYSAPSWALPPWPAFVAAARRSGPVDSPVVIGSRVVGDRAVPLPADRRRRDTARSPTGPASTSASGDVTDPEARSAGSRPASFPTGSTDSPGSGPPSALCAEAPPRIEAGATPSPIWPGVAATITGDGPLVVFHKLGADLCGGQGAALRRQMR